MNKPWTKGADPFASTEPMLPPGEEHSYAQTAPAPLESPAPRIIPELSLELAPMGGSEDDLMVETRKEGRVCPLPTRWLEFYRVLQDARPGVTPPSPPLTGSAWAATPSNAKRACFAEQAKWAVDNDCIPQAYDFLAGLPKSEWFYGN